jgi:F1F0 ATPase subunit 2
MFDLLTLIWAFALGSVLGAIFFGGLWWTIRRALASDRPALWFFSSLMVRMAIALGGFYLIGGYDWRRWAATLAGFVLARFVMQRLTPRLAPAQAQGGQHAA